MADATDVLKCARPLLLAMWNAVAPLLEFSSPFSNRNKVQINAHDDIDFLISCCAILINGRYLKVRRRCTQPANVKVMLASMILVNDFNRIRVTVQHQTVLVYFGWLQNVIWGYYTVLSENIPGLRNFDVYI